MFKLDLEKAAKPRIKLPTSVGSLKKQESSRKTSTSALLTMPKPLTMWITTNWKILQEMGIPNHLPCLLRNLYAGQEATVRTGLGTPDWFQIRKGVRQGCILSPCLFNFYAEYIMRNAGQEEKGTTENEMAGWHYRLDAHEFGWTLGVGDGQGGLVCCDSWGRRELDTTEQLNWNEYSGWYKVGLQPKEWMNKWIGTVLISSLIFSSSLVSSYSSL